MTEALALYGPDSAGIWDDANVALGSRSLHITPESRADSQPASSSDGKVQLVFDGILDDREETGAQLGFSPREIATLTDAELVLALYEQKGVGALLERVGDFAGCVWDGRRRLLYAFRDAFGIRPLFVAHLAGCCYIATSIAAIRRVSGIDDGLDKAYLRSFLAGTCDAARHSTPFRGVKRVQAACAVSIDECGSMKEWNLSLTVEKRSPASSDEVAVRDFMDAFSAAVQDKARSRFPIALQVSGGVDSSSIATLLHRLAGERRLAVNRPRIYSWQSTTFPRANETEYLRLVSHACRPWETVVLEQDEMWALRHAFSDPEFPLDEPEVWYLRRPLVDLMRRVSSDGRRVILSGLMADQVMSSGALFTGHSFRSLASGRGLSELLELIRAYQIPPHLLLWQGVLRPFATGLLPEPARNRIKRLKARRREPAWLRGRSSHRDTAPVMAEGQSNLPLQVAKFHDGQWQILFSTIAQSAATNSVQFRMPFLDLRIARMLGALPGRFHFRDGFDKWLLRQAMNGTLPQEIRQRKGGGILDDLVHDGLVRRERELVESLIENSRAADLGIVDATKIRWEFSRYWQNHEFVPWDLIGWINVEIWLRNRVS